MGTEIKDFIGVYKNVFPKEECEKIINYFESSTAEGFVYNRQQQANTPGHQKKDLSLDLNSAILTDLKIKHNHVLIQPALSCIWDCYNDYSSKCNIENMDNFVIAEGKIQKTKPTEGYHMWHYEIEYNRFAVFMIYLNDVAEGGETEFLNQKQRISPTQGTVVIFPASYTHLHRGNPPFSNDKYIFTGWFLAA